MSGLLAWLDEHVPVSPVLMWGLAGVACALSRILPAGVLLTGHRLPLELFILWVICDLAWLAWGFYFHRQAPLSAERVDRLAVRGPYAYVRHPMYLFHILTFLAAAAAFPYLRVVAAALAGSLIFAGWTKREEKVLLRRFGREYEEYRRRVPALIPFLKRRSV